jgi:sugar phosphate isomerase/epimerase
MVWRIGEILDFDEQVAWTAAAGFESIGFHASRGTPGQWQGIDPADADAGQRRRIRKLLVPFRQCEIHAPFDAQPSANTSDEVLLRLEKVLQFASDVGVSVVTVHADKPPSLDADKPVGNWHQTLAEIRYRGSMILEPNPDRVTPEGIRRSAEFLRQKAHRIKA